MKNKILWKTRAENLSKIMNDRFSGDIARFAESLDIGKITLKKYLKPNSDRPCKDSAARKIEGVLDLEYKSLDHIERESKYIYYVSLHTNTRYNHEIVKALQSEESIKECAVVLGNVDIWLKMEINSYTAPDFLLSKIVKMPGVKRVNTHTSAQTIRWQRGQSEDMNLPEKDESLGLTKGIEKFIHKKMNHHFNEIEELDRGEISVKDNDSIQLHSVQLIQGTERAILATRNPLQRFAGLKEYIPCEKSLIESGIKVRRLIFLDKHYKKRWNKIEKDYNEFKKTGCDIRFIHEASWNPTHLSEKCEQFTVIDHDFVCVRRDEQSRLLIKRTLNMVQMYKDAFNNNWEDSLCINAITKTIYQNGR